MPHCVMVAQQILVLYVWVRILVGQQHEINKNLIPILRVKSEKNSQIQATNATLLSVTGLMEKSNAGIGCN